MVWAMGDLYAEPAGDSHTGVAHLACSIFKFGRPADAPSELGTAELSMPRVVSYRRANTPACDFESVYRKGSARVFPVSDHRGTEDGRFLVDRPSCDGNEIRRNEQINTMRVFTDGACSKNGKPDAKAGFAVWFPEHKELSVSRRLPNSDPQTNQRAEMSAIACAAAVLETAGYLDEDILIYTDSEYCINCFTKWLSGWVSRGWKTAEGKDVLHQELIRETSGRLAKFKSHRFVHVKAHSGAADDLSKNNDIVDRMARSTIDDTVRIVEPPTVDDLFPGCPLQILGPPIAQTQVLEWVRANLNTMDRDIVDKHLMKAFTEICKARDIALTKQTISKTPVFRAERAHLKIEHVIVEKVE